MNKPYDLIVVGAGPSGLMTACEAKVAGLNCLVIEKGCIVNSIYHFPTFLKFFSTPELLELGGMPFLTTHDKPTRQEALEYYRRFAGVHDLPIRTYEKVVDIRKPDSEGFEVTTENGNGRPGTYRSARVVLATGVYDQPRTLGVPGEDLPKVSHYYTDAHPFHGKKVLVVGGKNSAAETALELARTGCDVTLSYRGDKFKGIKYWVQPDVENRIKDGAIRAYMGSVLKRIDPRSVTLKLKNGKIKKLENDFVFLLTGYEPNVEFLETAGIKIDPKTLEPALNKHLETNVKGLYVAGCLVAGSDNNRLFIENTRHHGGIIVKHILKQMRRRR